MLLSINELEMETILLGEDNINYLKKTKHREITDTIELQGFIPLIESPTRMTTESNTLIDVILSNKSPNISSSNAILLSLSDHDCTVCVRKINHKKHHHEK